MEQRGIFLSYFAINISQLPLSSLFLGLYRSTDVSQKVPTDNTKFCMNLSPISAGKFKLRFSWRTRMYLMSCNRFKTQPCNLSFPTKGCQAPSPLSSYDSPGLSLGPRWSPAPARPHCTPPVTSQYPAHTHNWDTSPHSFSSKNTVVV